MKRPQQPRPDASEPQSMSRQEKFLKRGLPALLGVAALSTGAYLTTQTVVNAANENQHVADLKEANQEQQDFMKLLDNAATTIADPESVIEGSTIVDPGNHLYDEAKAFADEHGLTYQENGVNTLLETSVAISKGMFIQPDSEFVISQVDVDGDGDEELIVQLPPQDLETK